MIRDFKNNIIILIMFLTITLFVTGHAAFGVAANNPLIYAPQISAINVDGNLSDWGEASTWSTFGPWYEYGVASVGNEDGIPSGLGSTTKSKFAWNDTGNMLYIGIESTEGQNMVLEVGGLYGEPNDPNVTTVGSVRASQMQFTFSGGSVTITSQIAGKIATGVQAAYTFDGTKMTIEIATPIYRDWTNSASKINLTSSSDLYQYANVFNAVGSSPRKADSQIANGKYAYIAGIPLMANASLIRLRPNAKPLNCADVPAFAKFKSDMNLDCDVDLADLGLLARNWLKCNMPGDPACQ